MYTTGSTLLFLVDDVICAFSNQAWDRVVDQIFHVVVYYIQI